MDQQPTCPKCQDARGGHTIKMLMDRDRRGNRVYSCVGCSTRVGESPPFYTTAADATAESSLRPPVSRGIVL